MKINYNFTNKDIARESLDKTSSEAIEIVAHLDVPTISDGNYYLIINVNEYDSPAISGKVINDSEVQFNISPATFPFGGTFSSVVRITTNTGTAESNIVKLYVKDGIERVRLTRGDLAITTYEELYKLIEDKLLNLPESKFEKFQMKEDEDLTRENKYIVDNINANFEEIKSIKQDYLKAIIDDLIDVNGDLISGGDVKQALIDITNNIHSANETIDENTSWIDELEQEMQEIITDVNTPTGDLTNAINKLIDDSQKTQNENITRNFDNMFKVSNDQVKGNLKKINDTSIVINTNEQPLEVPTLAFLNSGFIDKNFFQENQEELVLDIAQLYQLQDDSRIDFVQDGNVVNAINHNNIAIVEQESNFNDFIAQYAHKEEIEENEFIAITEELNKKATSEQLSTVAQSQTSAVNALTNVVNDKVDKSVYGLKMSELDTSLNEKATKVEVANLSGDLDQRIEQTNMVIGDVETTLETSVNDLDAKFKQLLDGYIAQQLAKDTTQDGEITRLRQGIANAEEIVVKNQGESDLDALNRVITAPINGMGVIVTDEQNFALYVRDNAKTPPWVKISTTANTSVVDLSQYLTTALAQTTYLSKSEFATAKTALEALISANTTALGGKQDNLSTAQITALNGIIGKVFVENSTYTTDMNTKQNKTIAIDGITATTVEGAIGETRKRAEIAASNSFIADQIIATMNATYKIDLGEFATYSALPTPTELGLFARVTNDVDSLKNGYYASGSLDSADVIWLRQTKVPVVGHPYAFTKLDADALYQAKLTSEQMTNVNDVQNKLSKTEATNTYQTKLTQQQLDKIMNAITSPIGTFETDFIKFNKTSSTFEIIAYPNMSDKTKYIAMIWDKQYSEFRIENYTTAEGVITTIAGDAYSIRNRTQQLLRIFNNGKHNANATHTLIQLLDFLESNYTNIGSIGDKQNKAISLSGITATDVEGALVEINNKPRGTTFKHIIESASDTINTTTLNIGNALAGNQYYGTNSTGRQTYGSLAIGLQTYGSNATGSQIYGAAKWANLGTDKVEFNFGKDVKTVGTATDTHFATSTDGTNWTNTTHTADEMIKHLDGLTATGITFDANGHVIENGTNTGKNYTEFIVGKSLAAVPPSLPTWTSTSISENNFITWDKQMSLQIGKSYTINVHHNNNDWFASSFKVTELNSITLENKIVNFKASLQNDLVAHLNLSMATSSRLEISSIVTPYIGGQPLKVVVTQLD